MSAKSSHVMLAVGDPFFAEEKINQLTAELQKRHTGDIPRQIYYLSDTPLDAVLIQARTLPFLSSHQIFIVRDLQKIKKKDLEILESYLNHPFEGTSLVFEGPDVEKNSDLFKLFDKCATVHLPPRQAGQDLTRFIRNKVKQAGRTIAPEAVEKLKEEAGSMPIFLDSMLERLFLYSGSSTEITLTMVQTFEENWSETNIFKITDAIAEKNTNKGLALLREVLEENEKDLIGLLGILHWQIRRLWLAKSLLERGKGEDAVLKKCRVSFRQAPFFMKQVRLFSLGELEHALDGIFQLDWKIKSGRAEGAPGIESWLVSVTR